MKQAFHITDVLSVYSGRLVGVNGIGGVYEVLNFLTGENLMTHQLPRAAEECRDWLKQQHPFLETIDCTGLDAGSVEFWQDNVVQKYGRTIEIECVPDGVYTPQNPLEELVGMMDSSAQIVVVDVGSGVDKDDERTL